MEPQPSDNYDSNSGQYFFPSQGYNNYQIPENQGVYPPQYVQPAENHYGQSPPGFNTPYMGQPGEMMGDMMEPLPHPVQNTEMYTYQYPEADQMPLQPSMVPQQQFASNSVPQYANNQFGYNQTEVHRGSLVNNQQDFIDPVAKHQPVLSNVGRGSPSPPGMSRPQQEMAQDFSSSFGFNEGYSMQSFEEENKNIQPMDNLSQRKNSIPKENEDEDSPEKEQLNIINMKKVGKESRKRRKSSTLDMLETDNYLKEVQEQMEKVKDQNTTESGSEEISSKNSKGGSTVNSLRGSLKGKKVCAPYRPSNYQATHLSPSPKRMDPLNSPTMRSMRSGTFSSNQGPPKIQQNLPYEDQESFGFSLQLNRTEMESSTGAPPFQRAYSHSMKYQDPSRIQNYPPAGVPQQMHQPMQQQNMHGSSFRNNQGYSHYGRDTYSPDVNRRAYMGAQEMKRYSHHNPHMAQDNWQGYSQNQFQPQAYPNQAPIRQSAPERQMNLRTDSSRSSIDMNSISQGEDMEAKSLSNYDDGGNKVDINSPDLIKKAYEYAKDQSGCRSLQRKIAEGSPEAIGEIYESILPHFVELMNNPFGNYLCQKITEAVDEEKLKNIIESIREEVDEICWNAHGTRAIQKIVECCKTRELKDMVINLLKDNVQDLVEDINGNHVIQKILFTFRAPDNEFIFETMISRCREIAWHKHGCCVMQKWIDGANSDQRERLIDEIIKHTQALVRDKFANYVLQLILDKKDYEINSRIGQELVGPLLELGKLVRKYNYIVTNAATRKYSSNVIEKCLQINKREVINAMVKEMVKAESYLQFLNDPYGNYVVQKTLAVAEKEDKLNLIAKIKPEMEELRRMSDLGAKIYNKLVKAHPSLQIKGKGGKPK